MKHLPWAAAAALLLLAAPAHAQATRTWVSGLGDDANPCTLTARCKTFGGAISKTAAGGIISVFDAGGYGQVTVTKSISIIAEGVQAGVLVSGSNGITINAGANDVVRLHGLFIDSLTLAGIGIRIVSAGSVYIDHCSIRGFATAISVDSPGAEVFVSDCSVALNTTGIAATQGSNEVVLDRVRIVKNQTAIAGGGNSTIFHLNNSTLADNTLAIGPVDGAILSSKTNAFSGNGSNGQAMTPEPLQ